jgi:hypothetical protein
MAENFCKQMLLSGSSFYFYYSSFKAYYSNGTLRCEFQRNAIVVATKYNL